MALHSFFHRLAFRRVPWQCKQRSRWARPLLETLEDRTLLDTGLNQLFVQQSYRDLLGREVEPGGRAFWTGLLDGGVSRDAVVLGIENSLEYRTNLVGQLYQQLLLRPADPLGLNDLASFMGAGGHLELARAFIISSPEYFANRSGSSNSGFLTEAYHDVLDRSIDPAGQTYWESLLTIQPDANGRLQVAEGLVESREGRQEWIQSEYRQFLSRTAEAAGLAAWLAVLNAGGSEQQVVAGIAGSAEYLGRATAPTGPQAPVFDVAAGVADAGPDNTKAARVTLVGHTDPGVSLSLVGTQLTALASATGAFQIPGVELALGDNPLTVQATDSAGHSSTFSRTVTRSASITRPPNEVLVWNQATLNAIEQDGMDPLFASRGLAMAQAAVFDAVNAVAGTPAYYVKVSAPAGASIQAAVDASAHDVLGYLFPAQQATFDTLFASQLSLVPDGQSRTDGEAVGQAAGDGVIRLRANDGSRSFVDFAPSTAPGDWQPTAPAFAPALDPQWANLTPFAMTSPDQFRPSGPPALTSQEWADAVNEVKSLGSADSTTRSADETEIARFWADGGGTYSPPGHWNAIAQTVAQQQGDSLVDDARLFAELDVTLADAGITAWNTKYHYDTWRPITVIRDPSGADNPLVQADPNWSPLLTTPPFPEYVSGHSTFSGAAADILDNFFGTNVGFTSTEETLPGVTRSFSSFDQAALEAGRSRIYGGIHFEFSDADGLSAGRALASYVLGTFDVRQDVAPPHLVLDSAGGASKTNVTITGQVTDNLSGVAKLQVQVDQGAFTALSFNAATGKFSFPTSFALDGTADGAHTINFLATDVAGNTSTPVTFTFTLGTQAPTLTLTTPSEGGALDVTTLLTGTATTKGPAVVALGYTFDGGTRMPITFDADGTFSQTLDLSRLAAGAHTLVVTAQDAAGNITSQTVHLTQAAAIPLVVSGLAPTSGMIDVGVTFRPKVSFSRPVDVTSLDSSNFFAADTTGTKLAATIVPSDDGTFAWLFFSQPMPGGSTITVNVDGSTIRAADGSLLDAAANGTPGSTLKSTFTTVSEALVPGTTLSGVLADPGPDLKPMSRDDVRNGADDVLGTADDVYLRPIQGVKVFILGHEDQAIFTDAQGRFSFPSVPVGDVKLELDGNVPGVMVFDPTQKQLVDPLVSGFYFPVMVMDLTMRPGIANTVMGSMGSLEEQGANTTNQGVYLPRLQTSILHSVSDTQPTTVGLTADSAPDLTPEQQSELKLTVQPGTMIGQGGQKMASGQIGVSIVPPDLVKDMLPEGDLQHTFDITIQAPGVATFTTPAQLTFPNVFNAAPGTQLDFLSFDHTTGMLVIEGTATVSADGKTVTTDPGMGITHPGWHGLTPPGGCGGSGGPPTTAPTAVQPGEKVTEHPTQVLDFINGNIPTNFKPMIWTTPATEKNAPPPIAGCQVPQHGLPGRLFDGAEPFINVTIVVDGSDEVLETPKDAANFKSPGLNLTTVPFVSQSFTLSPVSPGEPTEAKELRLATHTFDLQHLATFFSKDTLLGVKFTVTVIEQHEDGTRTRDIFTFYEYRWLDVSDPAGGAVGIGAAFLNTLVGTSRPKFVDVFLPHSDPTLLSTTSGKLVPPPDFEVTNAISGDNLGESTIWNFKPTKAGSVNEPINIFVSQLGSSLMVGTLDLLGRAVDPVTIDVNSTKFQSELERVIRALASDSGPDGKFGTADDDYEYHYALGNFALVSSNFKQEFLNPLGKFLDPATGDVKDQAGYDTLLDTLTQTAANDMATQVRNIFSAINGGVRPFQFADGGTAHVDYLDLQSFDVGSTLRDLPGDALVNVLGSKLNDVSKAIALSDAMYTPGLGESDVNLAQAITWTSDVHFGVKVASIVAHELALQFGLEDDFQTVKFNANDVEPIPDIMNSYHDDRGAEAFGDKDRVLLRLALGVEALDDPAQGLNDSAFKPAIQMYKDNFFLDLQATPIPQRRVDTATEGPEIGVGAPDGLHSPGDTVSLGTAPTDGSGPTSVNLVVSNVGAASLTIQSLGLANGKGSFQISNPPALPLTLQPGDTLPLTVVFSPVRVGTFTDQLTIASNARVAPSFALDLTGEGISETPFAELALGNNDLGGVGIGASTTSDGLATITNRGIQDLHLSSIQVVNSGSSFSLTGLPDFSAGDVVLKTGESFSFEVTYTAGTIGFERAQVEVTTNDPNHPVLQFGVMGTGVNLNLEPHWGHDYIAIEFPDRPGTQPLRALSDNAGNFSLFLPPNTAYHLVVFDPFTDQVAHAYGATLASGKGVDLTGDLAFGPSTAADSDSDGLPDDVEFAVGTNPHKADTNGDGIDDFTALAEGLNPLGSTGIPTGVIASLPLQGEAKAIVAQGSTTDPTGQTLYVATGSYGLAVVDASKFNQPVVLGQVQLPGNSVDVAFAPGLNLAVVAAGEAGVHLVDVSNPAQPTLQQTIAPPSGAQAVRVYDGLAYVASGTDIVSIDLASGEALQTLFAGGTTTGLAREGATLYSMDSANTLHVIDISGSTMVARGSLSLPAAGGPLVVGNGIAYVAATSHFQTGGFTTVDVTNPDSPRVLGAANSGPITFPATAIIPNGSGQGLLLGQALLPAGTFIGVADLMDLSDPTSTTAFVTQFGLPNVPNAAAIADGIGYVADGSAGLQVVNYLPFDTQGKAPTVSITVPVTDEDLVAPGLQVFEGTTLPVIVTVSDDVQVRNVELLVNGQVVQNDVSFPFELSAIAPSIAQAGNTLTLQVRTTDTGGNVGLSNGLVIGLLNASSPPTITEFDPANGSSQPEGPLAVQVHFSKALAVATVTAANFQLQDAAGHVLAPVTLELRGDDQLVEITYGVQPAGGYQLVINAPAVTDRVGNALATAAVVDAFTLTPTEAVHVTSPDADPNTPGLQLFEGSVVTGTVTVAPTVNVSSIELLLNGQVVSSGNAAPLNFSVTAPRLSAGATSFTLQGRVTDTTGQVTETGVISIGLLKQILGPNVVGTSPSDTDKGLAGLRSIAVDFDQALNPASVKTSNFQITGAGPDGKLGTADDVVFPALGIQFQNDNTRVLVRTPPLPDDSYQLTLLETGITGRSGVPMGGATLTFPFTIEKAQSRIVVTDIPAGVQVGHAISTEVFDPFTGKVLDNVSGSHGVSNIDGLVVTADGSEAFIGDGDSPEVVAFGLTNAFTQSTALSSPIFNLALTPDQKYLLATGNIFAPVFVIDAKDGGLVSQFATGSDNEAIAVARDGTVLVASVNKGTVRRLQLDSSGNLTDTGDVLAGASGSFVPARVAIAPDGKSGVVVQRFGQGLGQSSARPPVVRSFTIPGLKQVDVRDLSGFTNLPDVGAFGGFGQDVQISPSGHRLYVLSQGLVPSQVVSTPKAGAIDVFDYDTATGAIGTAPLFTIPVLPGAGMVLSADGALLYVSQFQVTNRTQVEVINIYNAATGALLGTLSDPSIGSIFSMAVSGAGDFPFSEVPDPTAIDDTVRTTGGVPVTVNVLANDFDNDSDGLVVASVTQPAHGTVTINPDSSVTYVPNPGFFDQDQFTYTARDLDGQSSTATVTVTPRAYLTTTIADADPGTPGLQISEASTVPLHVDVDPSITVQDVALFENGKQVADLTAGPFNFSLIAPRFSPTSSSFTLEAHVKDATGNTAISNVLTIGLFQDVTPPSVVGGDPVDGGNAIQLQRFVQVDFSESLIPTSAAATNFRLVSAGPNGVVGDGDDVVVAISAVQLQNDDRELFFTTDPLPAGPLQLQVNAPLVTDRVGNPLGTGTLALHYTGKDPGIVLVADSFHFTITALDAGTQTELGSVTLPGPFSGATLFGDIVISADRKFAYVADNNSRIWVLDLTGPVPQLASGINPIPSGGEDLALTPDQRFLVVAGFGASGGALSVVDVATRTEVSTVVDGALLVATGSDGSVLADAAGSGSLLRFTIDAAGQLQNTGELGGFHFDAGNIYIAPGNKAAISISTEIALQTFSIPGLQTVAELPLTGRNGVSAVFSPDGKRVYVRSNSPGGVAVYDFDPDTGAIGATPLFTIPVEDASRIGNLDQLALSPDGRVLYVPESRKVALFEANAGRLLGTITDPSLGTLTGIAAAGE
jgi:hypothetical protein